MQNWQAISSIEPENELKKLAALCRRFPCSSLLLSNDYPGSEIQVLAGFGAKKQIISSSPGNAFGQLKSLSSGEYWFGHFSYDLKNETEALQSLQPDRIGFAAMQFFSPEFLFRKNRSGELETAAENADAAIQLLSQENPVAPLAETPVQINAQTSRETYLRSAKKLLAHIHRGDIYEINYCIGFYAENVQLDPPSLFLRLNQLAGAPFTALYRNGDQWLICASPERFLQKKGNRLISQPIKGTKPRGKTAEEDRLLAEELKNDPKERSENVMIVDLVRNDLSKVAERGSVKVDELFGIHSFKTVHQMISTVSAGLKKGIHSSEAIRATFPMGSMTGAPKLRAMQLAGETEEMRRGLYSGAVGYFSPGGDFDFNVVIRSIQYNAATGYLSFMVGSALTAAADPEKEYGECLVKARGLFDALGVKFSETYG